MLTPSCATAQTVGDVYRQVRSSVVVVRTIQRDAPTIPGGGEVHQQGVGSGVLVSEDGLVLTAAHVVQVADRVMVEFQGGQKVEADVVASRVGADLALVQINGMYPRDTPVASLGDSDKVTVGDQVMVVGAPRGIDHTLTVGHISAKRLKKLRDFDARSTEFFQTDASINPGNSGGPMFNLEGEVIGIVSHIVTVSGGSEGLGFAVTSNQARRSVLNRQAFWSGVDGTILSAELGALLNVPNPSTGFLVRRVAKGSPGQALGLVGGEVRATLQGREVILGGDIITEVQGVVVQDGNAEKLQAAVDSLSKGDTLKVKVLRRGVPMDLQAVL